MKRVLIIGAGASGMVAAIWAARNGARVTLYEKNDRVGKKILATGNGKCNLGNKDMDMCNYYVEDTDKLKRCFERFGVADTIAFFSELGLMTRDRDGYLYPYCEQASSVLDVLRNALTKYDINVKTSVENIVITAKKNETFLINSSEGRKEFDAIILACGSKAGIKNGTTEGFDYSKQFGHRIIPLLPALVQLRCKGDYFKSIAGVRCKANIKLCSDGRGIAAEQGELQLTDYGISGIPVFQISRVAAKELKNRRKVEVIIDFIPDFLQKDWEKFVNDRIQKYRDCTCEEFLTGTVNKKIALMLLKKFDIKGQDTVGKQTESELYSLCMDMKSFRVLVQDTNSYEQAQVCCGGVDFMELDENMQSKYQPNLFICGEMVDVDGKCGGYNLQWAWTSGYLAGTYAAIGRK